MTSEEYKEQLSEALGKLAGVHAVGDSWITFDGSIPAGGVPFTGQLVSRAMYADLWAWVQANKTVVTDAAWQATASAQNGMCASYSSGDGSSTFRMPNVVGGYFCGGDTSTAGQYVEAGLPNITGSLEDIRVRIGAHIENNGTGAFRSQYKNNSGDATGGEQLSQEFSFDASRSNPIYGKSNTVTPETFKVLVGVYAFGVAGSIGEATEEGIVAELNRKADIDASNFSTAGKNVLAGMGMPSGRYVDLTLGASETAYTAPANGWFALSTGSMPANSYLSMRLVKNGIAIMSSESKAATAFRATPVLPVTAGDIVKISYSSPGSLDFFRFIYAEGAS